MRQRSFLLLFITFATFACFTYYAADMCLRDMPRCFGRTEQEMGNAEKAPFRYRLLEPAIRSWLVPDGNEENTVAAMVIVQGVLLAGVMPSLFTWLRRSTNDDRAMLGVALLAIVMISAFHLWFLQTSIMFEMLFVLLALLCIKRWRVLAVLTLIASTNRETALLIPAVYLAWHGRTVLRQALELLAIWAVTTAAIHLARGSAEHMLGIVGTLQYNIGDLATGGIPAALVIAPLFLAFVYSYRNAPLEYKRLAVVGAVYLAAVVGGGAWGEVQRLCLPALPLLLPMVFTREGFKPSPNPA